MARTVDRGDQSGREATVRVRSGEQHHRSGADYGDAGLSSEPGAAGKDVAGRGAGAPAHGDSWTWGWTHIND